MLAPVGLLACATLLGVHFNSIDLERGVASVAVQCRAFGRNQ